MKRGGPLKRHTALRRAGFRPKRHYDREYRTVWAWVMERAGWRCEVEHDGTRCENRATQAHHVLRRSQGGADDPSNLLATCAVCHHHIHAHPEWAYQRGYLRRSSSVRLIPGATA